MPFDAVHDEVSNIESAVYESAVVPLIHRSIGGESTMCVLGGQRSGYLSTLVQASSIYLLDTASKYGEMASVKLSWFTIGADGSEPIVDVLRTPQSVSTLTGSKNTELVLRDLVTGRGMVVKGVVEVELSSQATSTPCLSMCTLYQTLLSAARRYIRWCSSP
jgi:hypothetical protein